MPGKVTDGLLDVIKAATDEEQQRVLNVAARQVKAELPDLLAPGNSFSARRRTQFLRRIWIHGNQLFLGISKFRLTQYLGQSRLAALFRTKINGVAILKTKRGFFFAVDTTRPGLPAASYVIRDEDIKSASERVIEAIRQA